MILHVETKSAHFLNFILVSYLICPQLFPEGHDHHYYDYMYKVSLHFQTTHPKNRWMLLNTMWKLPWAQTDNQTVLPFNFLLLINIRIFNSHFLYFFIKIYNPTITRYYTILFFFLSQYLPLQLIIIIWCLKGTLWRSKK